MKQENDEPTFEKLSASVPLGTTMMVERIIEAMLHRGAGRSGRVTISRVILEALREKAKKEQVRLFDPEPPTPRSSRKESP
jgi:hypothetical protein